MELLCSRTHVEGVFFIDFSHVEKEYPSLVRGCKAGDLYPLGNSIQFLYTKFNIKLEIQFQKGQAYGGVLYYSYICGVY